MGSAQVSEVPKSSDRAMDVAAYEERLEVHEQHLRNHADQLVESETSLADLRDQLRLAEAERDRERQEHERLLRKQLELVQASQRNFSPGAGPIHQYKDFKTVRGFRFKVQGEPHKIEVAHHKGIFQLALDGQVVGTLVHKVFGAIFRKEQKRMTCTVVAPNGASFECRLKMEWAARRRCWHYSLSVNSVGIPPCWERRSASGSGHYMMDA